MGVANDTAMKDADGREIAIVHAGRPIHVMGVSEDGSYLEIAMHDGRAGIVRLTRLHSERNGDERVARPRRHGPS
jgi:hypothetical protein